MADTKISAMTPALQMLNADLLPIVNALANFRCTKALLLSAAGGETIFVHASGGNAAGINDVAGTTFAQIVDPGQIQLNAVTQILIACTTAGGPVSATFNAGPGRGSLQGAGGWFVAYVPAAAGNWAVPMTDLAQAVDRLAAAMVARTIGGPV